jgi:catechol-2,3-dioxygenase
MPDLRLDHLNIPARDPLGLARWYGETFGLTVNQQVARGSGMILVFRQGEPLGRSTDEVHMGFRVPSLADLDAWAGKFAAQPVVGPEFTSFRITDPEGNGVELYTPSAA